MQLNWISVMSLDGIQNEHTLVKVNKIVADKWSIRHEIKQNSFHTNLEVNMYKNSLKKFLG